MKEHEFGTSSKEKLSTAHTDLQKIFNLAIKRSKVDFGISEGHRPIRRQQFLYAIGRYTDLHKDTVTNIDGIHKKGKHNLKPSEAVDIYIYHPDRDMRKEIIYHIPHLSYIAGIIDACAEELLKLKEITHKVRWGGNWDSDGIIALDQSFDDYPHFELIKI